jgi:hypothetical protein
MPADTPPWMPGAGDTADGIADGSVAVGVPVVTVAVSSRGWTGCTGKALL